MFSADSQSVASAAAFAGCDGDQLSPQSRLVAARCTLFVSRLLTRSGPSLARHSRPLVMKRAELLIPPAAGQHCPLPLRFAGPRSTTSQRRCVHALTVRWRCMMMPETLSRMLNRFQDQACDLVRALPARATGRACRCGAAWLPPAAAVSWMALLAAAGRCSCRRMLLGPSLAARRGDQRSQRWRDYHATAPLRQQALSNADMVAWHDGASVVEAVTPNGLIVVNGVTIQGSAMVFPRLCLLWHVSGLEVRFARGERARSPRGSSCARGFAGREREQPLTAVNLPPTSWCDPDHVSCAHAERCVTDAFWWACSAEHFILGVGETTPAIPPEVKEYCRRLCDASAPIAPQPQLPVCLLAGTSVRADASCLTDGNCFCKCWAAGKQWDHRGSNEPGARTSPHCFRATSDMPTWRVSRCL